MPLPPPPAISAPADPNAAIFKQIIVEVGGRAYTIPVGAPCSIAGIRAAHPLISLPSRKVTLFIPCDGPGGVD